MSKLNTVSCDDGNQNLRSHINGKLKGASSQPDLPFVKLALAGCLIGGYTGTALAQDEMMEIVETFEAVGQGESRATNSLDLETLDIIMPGLTPEKMIDRVPGVNVVTRDPFGFYEFGNDVRVRAFNISNLGVTLDGVPVGNSDPRYGSPIGRLVDGPNMANIKVSQGAGDVTTPAYQALGGSLQYTTIDPSYEAGGMFQMSYGSFDHINLFGRFETGEITPGLTAYVSASHFEFTPRGLEGLGKGVGRRFETKVKYDFPSDNGSIRFVYTYNDRDDFDTAGLSYGEWQDVEAGDYNGTGQGYIEYTPWDYPGIGNFNYGDLSDEGRNLGPVAYLDPASEAGEGTNAIYYNMWRNGRMDSLYRTIIDYQISENLAVNVIPYYQDKNNYGLWGRDKGYAQTQIRKAYEADPTRTDIWGKLYYDANGNPLAEDGTIVAEYSADHAIAAPSVEVGDEFLPGVPGRTARDENFGGHRYGLTTSFTYKTENHKILFGGWYEFDYHSTERPNYNLAGGSVTGDFQYDQFNFLNYTRYIDQTAVQLWLQDTFTTMDGKMDVVLGVKALQLDRDARGFLAISDWLANEEVVRSVKYEDMFLPQFGLVYRMNDSSQLFFNYSENMATPNSGTITTAGSGFNADILKPEYSENFDIGIRASSGNLSYNAQAYMISYTDRILSSAVPIDSANAGAAGNSVYQNVGGVDSWGAELSGDWNTPIEGLKLIGSIAVQETTFQEDLFSGFSDTADVDEGYRTEINPEATGDDDAYLLYEAIAGNDLGNTPFLTVGMDGVYKVKQFRFNLGMKYYDDVYVNTLNTQPLDSYVLFDAGMSYEGKADTALEGWSASLSIHNLTDEYVWLARSYSDADGQVLADRGRQFTLTVKTRF